MNEVIIFNNPEFGQVRTVNVDGEPWFVGKDVADALGYENASDALNKHIHKDDKQIIQKSQITTFDVPNRGMTIINESGLYALIFGSKLASAVRFKRWVTSEVLPSIRKTGSYNATTEQIPYDKYLEAAKLIVECKPKDRNLIMDILRNGGFKIPVVDMFSIDSMSVKQKEFTEDFVKFLNDNGYSYKNFSEISGLPKSSIHNYATGKTVADEKNMKILKEYGFGKTEIKEQKEGEKKMGRIMTDWEKAIRHELLDRDMNLPDLANAVGINITYLYDIMSGARKATEMRQKINDFLGLGGEE